jgi:hypothetical protein
MGMYTEFHFNVKLVNDLPKKVESILKYMIGDFSGEDIFPSDLPNHKLFSTPRWQVMLRGDSYYFAADTISVLRYDDIANSYFLCVRCNFKNYDSEIELFLDWIHPYIEMDSGEFLGFYRYEMDKIPTLIYHEKDE